MRRLFKFLHELGSFGLMGALAAHLVLVVVATRMKTPAEYATVRQGIYAISQYLLLPSLAVSLMTGLLAIAIHRPFHDAGWAWVKALMGIGMFEGTLGAVQGTARDAAELSVKIANGQPEAAALADTLRHEWGGLWTIMVLSLANVALAVWKPPLIRRRPTSPVKPDTKPAESQLDDEQ